MLIHSKNNNFLETDPARKKTRFLSSLLDLKLVPIGSKQATEDDSKRKYVKNCPIKPMVNESEIFENFTVVQKKKSLVDKNLITKSLGSHFIFSNLIKDKAMLELLLDKFKLCRVNKGQYLMKQNDNASSFFVLHEGELVVEIDGKVKKKLESGEGFGELALMYSSPRSASIKANKTSFLWFMDRATFRKAISSLIEKNFNETRKFIEQTHFFVYLTSPQKDKIASLAIIQKFCKGQVICKQGQLASSMYIVKSGLLMKTIGQSSTPIKEGSYFGEYTMLEKNCKWKETVIADDQSEVIALGSQDIESALGRSLPLIVIRNKAKQCLNNAKQFNKLSPHFQDLALDCFKIRNVNADETISSSTILFLVLEGEYQLKNQGGKTVIGNGNDKILYGSIVENEKIDEIWFKTNGKIAWTTKKQVLSAFKGTYEETLQKSSVILKTEIKHRDHIAQLRVQCAKYSINDFKELTKLGEGQFGTVFLVTDPSKTRFYALKCISKAETVKHKLEKHLINQKTVMEEMNYYTPFCVNYIRSYKDDNFIYFLMEYINGLQLFDVIRLIGILNTEQTRFYGAIMLEFLEKIHSKNIIYRDLKPENVMVSEDGYLKLIDMGTCKKLEPDTKNNLTGSFLQKTFTIIGTPNYMAPEIISGKGYSSPVDLWSLGVVLYQFMAGYVPFGEDAEDPYEIYQQILKKPLVFPKYMKDPSAISFVTQLMNKQPEMRLGGSYSSLKKHSFLSPIEWSALLEKKIKPAFEIPKNKLIEVEKLVGKAKNLNSQLPPATGKYLTRKDFNSKWDQVF